MAYSDTPMKVQWITVGGQQIPAFRPQYWDEEIEDWRVSSRLYPLPITDKDALEELQALNAQQEEIDAKMQQLVAGQSTVNVENFPEVQDVSDAAVLSAVQELRQENAEIKAGQSEILERLNQPIDTQVTGSNVEDENAIPTRSILKLDMETLIDSQVIEADSSSGIVYMYPNGANEIYLFVQIDAQPWSLDYRNQFGSVSTQNGFPNLDEVNEIHGRARPAMSFPIGYNPGQGIPTPSNIKEAKDWGIPITNSEYFRVRNQSDQHATATVNILRIWR